MCERNRLYDIVDEQIQSFIKDNRRFIDAIRLHTIINVERIHKTKPFHCTYIFDNPYNVVYIGKSVGAEGDLINFFDHNQQLIYRYYDVE